MAAFLSPWCIHGAKAPLQIGGGMLQNSPAVDANLLWAVNGGRLVELHRDWAVIDVPVNRSQRVFYRRNVDAAKIRLPWTRSGGSQ